MSIIGEPTMHFNRFDHSSIVSFSLLFSVSMKLCQELCTFQCIKNYKNTHNTNFVRFYQKIEVKKVSRRLMIFLTINVIKNIRKYYLKILLFVEAGIKFKSSSNHRQNNEERCCSRFLTTRSIKTKQYLQYL